MPPFQFYLMGFLDTLTGHLMLVSYLLAVTDEHAVWKKLKKLPPLLVSSLLASLLSLGLYAAALFVKQPEQAGPSAARCLEEIHAHLMAQRRHPAEVFTPRTGDVVRHIPMSDILFFETASLPHHVLLHTSGSRVDFLGSLNELAAQLGDRFIRTHRAYLVAADKIEAVDLKHNALWAGGRKCLLSRAGKAELHKKMGEGR